MDKIYSYQIGVKGLRKNGKNERFRIGDKVWLKPPNAKCHTKWQPAIITQDVLNQTVEVNGIPRYVKHIRPRNDTRSFWVVPDVEIDDIYIYIYIYTYEDHNGKNGRVTFL